MFFKVTEKKEAKKARYFNIDNLIEFSELKKGAFLRFVNNGTENINYDFFDIEIVESIGLKKIDDPTKEQTVDDKDENPKDENPKDENPKDENPKDENSEVDNPVEV